MSNFLTDYHEYTETTEVPKLFHTWCAILGTSSMLGKNFWLTRGHFKIYPNLYAMLIGSPGTGKGTCMNILQTLLLDAGYQTFAADKSSKEKFLLDFQDGFSFDGSTEAQQLFDLETFLGGIAAAEGTPTEVFILAEEFNDFIGTNNIDFISLLTKLWSYQGVYRNRLKNSKSVSISDPCVNILGGNTSAGFAMAFPPEIIGQGFLARLLPIYGEPTGRKISFPEKPSLMLRARLSANLRTMRETVRGEAVLKPEALLLLDRIHQDWKPIQDGRFEHYSARRFNQLLKLCLVAAAFDGTTKINETHVRTGNTILLHTEELMPKAIGEFGKAKNSDVTTKIMEALYTTNVPLDLQELWKRVSSDLNNIVELGNILSNLMQADKIQQVRVPKNGWLPKIIAQRHKEEFVDKEMKKRL